MRDFYRGVSGAPLGSGVWRSRARLEPHEICHLAVVKDINWLLGYMRQVESDRLPPGPSGYARHIGSRRSYAAPARLCEELVCLGDVSVGARGPRGAAAGPKPHTIDPWAPGGESGMEGNGGPSLARGHLYDRGGSGRACGWHSVR